jgi:biphenyl-2,3-diol 1,2-dioxygenase
VVIEASDLDEWERFGVDLLGMEAGEKSADALTLRADARAFRWFIKRGPSEDLYASGYEVADRAALDELVARLLAAGVPVTEAEAGMAAARHADRLVLTQDPMGNRVELVTGFADAPAPFDSARLLGRFATGTGGAGHHVLLTRGVAREEYLAFYCGLLGFKISDYIVEEISPGVVADLVFLHCNPRHHTLALGDGRGARKKTHHVMLEVDNIHDVGLAYDRCLAANQPLEMTLGSHPNDQMFSFYVCSPSGFSIEYGWGGLLIDDATWRVMTHDKRNSWGHVSPETVTHQFGAAAATR